MDIAKRAITTRYKSTGVGNPLNEVQREQYMRDCTTRMEGVVLAVLNELDELLLLSLADCA